jgi:hypothetical protein
VMKITAANTIVPTGTAPIMDGPASSVPDRG